MNSAPTSLQSRYQTGLTTLPKLVYSKSMASIKRNGQTIYSGGGKHGDKRLKRQRTRATQKRAALREYK